MNNGNKIRVTFDPQNHEVSRKLADCLRHALKVAETEKLDRLLARGEIVFKPSVNADMDQRLMRLFSDTGAICQLVKATPTDHRRESSITNQLLCPKCQQPVIGGPECVHCGVILEKAKNRIQTPKPSPSQASLVAAFRAHVSSAVATFKPSSINLKIKQKSERKKNPRLSTWLHRIGDAAVRLAMAVIIALILETGFVFLVTAMWHLYIETHVGMQYISMGSPIASSLSHISEMSALFLAWDLTLSALTLSTAAAIIGSLTGLTRFLHEPFGWIGKAVLWALPLSLAVGWRLQSQEPMIALNVACILSAIPPLCVTNRCIYLVQTVVPDAGSILGALSASANSSTKLVSEVKDLLQKWTNRH